MNIINTESSLLGTERPGVIPVESPTVPKALVTSNKMSIKLSCGSNTDIKYVPRQTVPAAKMVMTVAFFKLSDGTL